MRVRYLAAVAGDHLFHAADVDVEPERVAELHRAGAVQLVDIREPYEWEAGRIAGARHVEMERIASRAPTIDRERPVVFYCRGGVRSGLVANAFRRAGFDAFSMVGGMTAWVVRGLPLEPENGAVAPH
jgi:rhodanese-related sulfurtransferase